MAIATVTGVAGGEKVTCRAGASVECAFNVMNTSGRDLRLGLRAGAEKPAESAWFEVVDQVERDLAAAGNMQVRVEVRVPEGTAAGRHAFSLTTYATDDPEQFAASPMIAVEVPTETQPAQKPKPKPSGFRWWPIAAGAAVLVVAGGLTFYFMGSEPEPEVSSLVWNTAKWDEATWQ